MPIEFTEEGGKRVENIEKKYAQAYGPSARVIPALPVWTGFVACVVIAFLAGRQSVGETIIEVEKPVLIDNVPEDNLRRISVLVALLRSETGYANPFVFRELKTTNNGYVAFKILDKWAKAPTMDQSKDVESLKVFIPKELWERLK